MRIGLTGGIGSGKSTVSAMLGQIGATIIDADAISRAVTAPDGLAIPALIEVFGKSILTPQGALDRVQMRELVFGDPPKKAQLEAIVHPLVQMEMMRQSALAHRDGSRCIVFDIPLLLNTVFWRQRLHRILVIDCSLQTQITRVMQRDGWSADQVQRVILAQTPRTLRLQAADMVLFNDGITPQTLAVQVREIGVQFGL